MEQYTINNLKMRTLFVVSVMLTVLCSCRHKSTIKSGSYQYDISYDESHIYIKEYNSVSSYIQNDTIYIIGNKGYTKKGDTYSLFFQTDKDSTIYTYYGFNDYLTVIKKMDNKTYQTETFEIINNKKRPLMKYIYDRNFHIKDIIMPQVQKKEP